MYVNYQDIAREGMRNKVVNAFNNARASAAGPFAAEDFVDAIMELIMVMVQIEVDDLRDKIEKRGMYDTEY